LFCYKHTGPITSPETPKTATHHQQQTHTKQQAEQRRARGLEAVAEALRGEIAAKDEALAAAADSVDAANQRVRELQTELDANAAVFDLRAFFWFGFWVLRVHLGVCCLLRLPQRPAPSHLKPFIYHTLKQPKHTDYREMLLKSEEIDRLKSVIEGLSGGGSDPPR
jgi:hypothetical protein